VFSVTAPVVSPSPASACLVVPSTCRSKRPGSVLGDSCLTTVNDPVSRTLVIVQTIASP